MPATTHVRLRALHPTPPFPVPDAAAKPVRDASVLAGHSHALYLDDARATPDGRGNTCVHAAVSDGSMPVADADADRVPPTDPPTYPRVCVHVPADGHTLLRDHVQKPSFPYRTVLVGRGLIGQDDTEMWRRQRAWLKPAFQARHVTRLLPLVVDAATAFVDELRAATATDTPNAPGTVDVHAPLLATTFAMVGHLMLGEQSAWLDAHGDTLRTAFAQGLQPYFRDTPDGQRAADTMHAFTAQAFARHAEGTGTGTDAATVRPAERVTLLSRLLDPSPDSPYAGDDELRHDELMTVMFAGHETTAHTLAWCLYELARHPEQQARVRAAIRTQARALGKPPHAWSFREFHRVQLVTQALRETLRLWPVVANGPFRETVAAVTVGGVTLPARTAFQVPHWSLHRNPSLWETAPDAAPADAFDVDRPATRAHWNGDAYMPFSRPPRDCLGRHVATMEMQVVLTLVLAAFEVAYPVDEAPKRGHNWATLVPENGMRLTWTAVESGAGADGTGRARL